MLFSLFRAADSLAEKASAEAEYENDLKIFGVAQATKLRLKRLASRRKKNKKNARRQATISASIFSPIPLVWLLLGVAGGGGLFFEIIGAILLASFFWIFFYLLERIKSNNPFK